MSGARWSIGAVHNTDGVVERYGRHKRTGKFYKWSSAYGRLLRSRGVLEKQVDRASRDDFKLWARSQSLVPRTKRIEPTEPPMRLRALSEGRTFLGTVERGGNNRGPEVERIIRGAGGLPGQPWCGYFVAFMYKLAGSKSVTRDWGSTPLLGRLAGQKTIDKWDGEQGDIVVFNFPGGGVDSDHTGLLVGYTDAEGNKRHPINATHIKTLDGNSGVDPNVSDSNTGGDGVGYHIRPMELVDRVVRVTR